MIVQNMSTKQCLAQIILMYRNVYTVNLKSQIINAHHLTNVCLVKLEGLS